MTRRRRHKSGRHRASETSSAAERPGGPRPPGQESAPSSDSEALARLVAELTDRLASDESLTSNLQDPEAHRVLQWAAVRVEAIGREAMLFEDPGKRQSFLDEATGRLRSLLREVNRKMHEAYELPAPAISSKLEELLSEVPL